MRPPSDSTLQLFASLTPEQRESALLDVAQETDLPISILKAALLTHWRVVGRPKQQEPDGDWTYWFLRAGRGFGKTISAAQWARKVGLKVKGCRFALVAPTLGDARDTMVEGETGLLSILAPDELRGGSQASAWNRSMLELYLANGTKFKCFSSEEPDRLRGPQHHYAWCEEVSSWKDATRGDELETTWSNVKLGTRLGELPRIVLTSTPKPNKLTKTLSKVPAPQMRIVVGSSYENRDNLAEAWWQQVIQPYEGTRLGAQEIMAQLLEDIEGALWTAAQIEGLRVAAAPDLEKILVAVDPNASSTEASNSAGIVVVGLGRYDGFGYVLADRTVTSGGPRAWASAAVAAVEEFEADGIVAEKNNGGDMVKITLRTVDADVPVKLVWASRGKRTRAEPIASMYEGAESRVRHAGVFPELEEEMTTWTPDADSPDRMDALVWGLSELLLKRQGRSSTSVPRGRIPGVDRRPVVAGRTR